MDIEEVLADKQTGNKNLQGNIDFPSFLKKEWIAEKNGYAGVPSSVHYFNLSVAPEKKGFCYSIVWEIIGQGRFAQERAK